jgi:hypothetical protein
MLFVLVALGLCADDQPFDQPFPVILKVPVSKTTFKARMILLVCAIAAADAAMLVTYLWKRFTERVVPDALSEPFIPAAEPSDLEAASLEK